MQNSDFAATAISMIKQVAPQASDTQQLAHDFASRLRPGDLVILSGQLGAGKTTFVQGLAEGLRVRGPITSPTFVIARVHKSEFDGPDLVHVDAYRLNSLAELDDLDLDTSLDDSVTVVEWGEGKAEILADHYYLATIERVIGDDQDTNESRKISIFYCSAKG